MTAGFRRALRELSRLRRADPDRFEIIGEPKTDGGWLSATISMRIGHLETRPGGLQLRERESFTLLIGPSFPFEKPVLAVLHHRFAGFPHVIWSKYICLYQSNLEWNPADGLYGFFARLTLWLTKAALNEMDPIEGPLEPPHHITDFSQTPFVIRANAPVAAGQKWLGLAELVQHQNRIELIDWHAVSAPVRAEAKLALAVILPKNLPMEFPKSGSDFFAELSKQGISQEDIVTNLGLAALFTKEEDPIHLVLGLPMRRAADGTPKLHIAVWTTDAGLAKSLRNALPEGTDTDALRSLRKEIGDLIYEILAIGRIKWCQVLEDRSEIVVRRDSLAPAAELRGKRVLVLGCGALGSWIAEGLVRAGARAVHLVDNSIVKPGILVRQNYRAQDIGAGKAHALAGRITEIDDRIEVSAYQADAFEFVSANINRLRTYDLILDCTASHVFQMRLEREWRNFSRRTPPVVSFIIDATARSCLAAAVGANSATGPWDAFVQLKRRLCLNEDYPEIADAFYSDAARKDLFQPEPGCSDPTFSGSFLDVTSLASASLNNAVLALHAGTHPAGIIFSSRMNHNGGAVGDVVRLQRLRDVKVGDYHVRIAPPIFGDARAWVRQNNRIRSPQYETGGLLWGLWDDAVGIIWIFALSGPPSDSVHDPGHFICGTDGTAEEHNHRTQISRGVCGFVGFWHTHPNMQAEQSVVDILGMSGLVANCGENQRRALMLIFGRSGRRPTAGIYIYEAAGSSDGEELISVKPRQIALPAAIV